MDSEFWGDFAVRVDPCPVGMAEVARTAVFVGGLSQSTLLYVAPPNRRHLEQWSEALA